MALKFLNDGYFAGKVGIGTESPNYQLTLGGNAVGSTEGLRINDPSNAAYGAHFSFSDTPNEVWIGGITNNTYNSAIGIHRDSTRAITIDVNSNVGIGTENPLRKLDLIADLSTDAVRIKNTNINGGGLSVFAANGGGGTNRILTLGDSSENVKVAVIENGNVGIGTTTPGEKLEVNGNVKATDIEATSEVFWGSYNSSPVGRMYSGAQTGVVLNTENDGATVISGGDTTAAGSNLALFGGAHATAPNEVRLRSGSVNTMTIDSAGAMQFNAYNSTNNTGTPTYLLGTDASGNVVKVLGSNIPTAAPATPGSLVATIVGETIEIAFAQSSTPDIGYYQVWSSDDGGDYGLIAQITPTDFSPTMTVVDTTFVTGGTMSYRVFAVKKGVYSSPGTVSKTYTVGALAVTDMTVVNLNTAYYIQYEKPTTRFIDHIEIWMDSQTTSAALLRSNAILVYSGQNSSYMRNVNTSSNFHQFWVEVVTS